MPGGATVPILSGPTNRFRDSAFDFQYQWINDPHVFTLDGTRIHESMTLDASFASGASANPTDTLTTTRVTGTYYYKRKYGLTLSAFSTTGSADAGLYPSVVSSNGVPNAVPGIVTSANGLPDTSGWILEANYVPWLNTKLSLKATQYSKFNGAGTNYDGFGRNASDNNSLYALIWFAY